MVNRLLEYGSEVDAGAGAVCKPSMRRTRWLELYLDSRGGTNPIGIPMVIGKPSLNTLAEWVMLMGRASVIYARVADHEGIWAVRLDAPNSSC